MRFALRDRGSSLRFPSILALLSGLVAMDARSACCDLVKVEAEPASTHVRVCDPDASSGCSNWVFEGDVAHGTPQQTCVSGTSLVYQERLDAGSDWSPQTEARCDAEIDVEL